MEQLCPIHNLPFKLVPAGISKNTGKAYNAFWSCPTIGCREKPLEQPKPEYTDNMAKIGQEIKEKLEIERKALEPDWDKIARGKIRSLFLEARINKEGLTKLSEAEAEALKELVELAMNG